MGTKHRVEYGVYVTHGSINCQLAEKTGFTEQDAEKLLEALKTLFENDGSSARPEGSMVVEKVTWWKHPSKIGKYSSAVVHHSLHVKMSETKKGAPPEIELVPLPGLTPEIHDGR